MVILIILLIIGVMSFYASNHHMEFGPDKRKSPPEDPNEKEERK